MNQNPNNPYESTSYGSGQSGQNPAYPYEQAGQNNPGNPYDQFAPTQPAGPAGNYPPPQYPQQNPNPYAPNPYLSSAAPSSNPPTPAPAPPPYNPVSQSATFAPYEQGGGKQPPPALRPRSGKGMRIALIALAIIIILAGIVAAIAIPVHNNQVAQDNATATANAITIQNVTATARANATATAVASTYPFSANVKLNDPLVDNSKGAGWDTSSDCTFSGGAYHALDSQVNTYGLCSAVNTNYSDFTYQVSMQINKSGDFGGITFRGNEASSKNYSFVFAQDGNYFLLVHTSNSGVHTLQKGDASASGFSTGVGASNDIGVVARGSSIILYVNKQKLTTVSDSTYTSGQVGVIVFNEGNGGDVSFTNARVWALS